MHIYILPDLAIVDFTVLNSNNYLYFYTNKIKKHKLKPKTNQKEKIYKIQDKMRKTRD